MVLVEFSTCRKFIWLGVLFTWNRANHTKILMSSRSVIKFKVKFFTTTVKHLRGKVWTPWPAKFLYSKGVVAWMRGCSAAKREDIVNMDLRVVLWLPWHGNNMVRQFRLNSAKILNDFLWTKCLVKFFNQLKIRWVLCAWIYVFFVRPGVS